MSNLQPTDQVLLGAMMATIGAIWAISLAAYQFIYSYFEDTYLEEISKVRLHMKNGGKDEKTLAWLAEKRTFFSERLRNYMIVFGGYFAGGIVTFVSIIISGATIAYDKPEWIGIAGVCFVAALTLLVAFLLYEVWTSFAGVRKLRNEIRP